MTKAELRGEIAARARALPSAYCQKADEAICRHLLAFPDFQSADTVFCYVGTEREINTRPILRAALDSGKRLAVPLCVGKGIMEARQINSLDELVPGKYGILAPAPGCPPVVPEDIGLAVVPCSTGNDKGQRLGYGGGFYDRFLLKTSCPTVLLCRKRLACDEIPTEEHDISMDYLLTEEGFIRCL